MIEEFHIAGMHGELLCRPFHGLETKLTAYPAVNCWAIPSRPLHGLRLPNLPARPDLGAQITLQS
jgi:hypothetical protein